MNWLEIAYDLPLGHKTQMVCPEDCGSGEKLSVNHSNKSYWCYCYRCGYTAFEDKGRQSLQELARIKELNEQAEKLVLPLELPHDYTTEIPLTGRLWLYQAGITESVWKQYKLGYSAYLDRVILPVYKDDGSLIWYQCRALHAGQRPKYLQPSRCRDKVLFYSKRSRRSLQRIIVVEDILSAIRVGEVHWCVSMLGTKISDAQAATLGTIKNITTWLDPDKAGVRGAYNIRRVMGLITEVSNIVTKKDPKEYSRQQIKDIIGGKYENSTI